MYLIEIYDVRPILNSIFTGNTAAVTLCNVKKKSTIMQVDLKALCNTH